MIDREELERLHEAAGALDVVAWIYRHESGSYFLDDRRDLAKLSGFSETPLTDLNKANEIILTLTAENAALTEKVERLEEALEKIRSGRSSVTECSLIARAALKGEEG